MDEDRREDETVIITAEASPVVPVAARRRASVVVVAGSGIGEVFVLETRLTVGRGRDADVIIPDAGISRRHAHLAFDGGDASVEDLGSTNGTFVNGFRVNGVHPLADGDKLQFGTSTILRFEYQDETDAAFQRRMFESASRDALTGLFNRGHFLERLTTEVAYARRHAASLALMLFDVDHFKQINDTHGHPAGDRVLRDLASRVAPVVRRDDVFARHGGEEFAILLRFTDLETAAALAERARTLVAGEAFVLDASRIHVTVSIGVAGLAREPAGSPAALVAAADEALYRAKHGGRNRVEVHRPT